MGRKVSALFISSLFLASILAGCAGEQKTEAVAGQGEVQGGGKGPEQKPTGTPPAGTNPNLSPDQIENRAGSALGNK